MDIMGNNDVLGRTEAPKQHRKQPLDSSLNSSLNSTLHSSLCHLRSHAFITRSYLQLDRVDGLDSTLSQAISRARGQGGSDVPTNPVGVVKKGGAVAKVWVAGGVGAGCPRHKFAGDRAIRPGWRGAR